MTTTESLEFQITPQQRDLLIELVQYARQGKLHNPFILIPSGACEYTIHVHGSPSLRIQRLSDLDQLCAAELMTYTLNRMGTGKVYSLTQASYKAAQLLSELPIDLPPMHWSALVSDTQNQASIKARLKLFKVLRAKLRHEMVFFLPDVVLTEAVMALRDIGHQLDSAHPNPDAITHNIRTLGHQLMEHFSAEQAAVCSQTLLYFGSWCRVTYQLLDQLRRYQRF